MKYADKLKHPNWQKMRLKVLQKAKFTCKLCKDTETELHVHHNYYKADKEPWDYPLNAFTCICKHCHYEVERLKQGYNNFNIKTLKILKIDSYHYNGRIMLVLYNSEKNLRFYNNKSEYIHDFTFPDKGLVFKKFLSL